MHYALTRYERIDGRLLLEVEVTDDAGATLRKEHWLRQLARETDDKGAVVPDDQDAVEADPAALNTIAENVAVQAFEELEYQARQAAAAPATEDLLPSIDPAARLVDAASLADRLPPQIVKGGAAPAAAVSEEE